MNCPDDHRSRRQLRSATDDELFESYRRTRDETVRNEIVNRHLWLADRCARRYRDRGEPHDDLVQVGRLAMIKAVERFDPECGSFVSFAVSTIVGELKRHFRDTTWSISVPRRAKELRSRVNMATEELRHQLGRAPTVDELAGYAGLPREHVIETLAAERIYRPLSLDQSLPLNLSPRDAGTTEHAADREERLISRDLIARLDDRQRMVVYLTYYEGLSQREIGDRLGIGQVPVSRLLAAARKALLLMLRDAEVDAA